MIVRDEGHCILDGLKRLLSSIDTFAIVDTGSRDDTINIIRKFAEENNLPGIIETMPWENFAICRNKSLKLGNEAIRKYHGLPRKGPLTLDEWNLHSDEMWHYLITDADNIIVEGIDRRINGDTLSSLLPTLKTPCIKKYLTEQVSNADSYDVVLSHGNSVYMGCAMVRAHISGAKGWKYFCPIHEYIGAGNNSMHPINKHTLKGISFFSGRHGGRSAGGFKYFRDSHILEEALVECYIDPEDIPRCTYYLANSLKDCGKYDEAINYYQKRIDTSQGYEQEKYLSHIRIAELLPCASGSKFIQKKYLEMMSLEHYLKAHEIVPHRRESIKAIRKYYSGRDMKKTAWSIVGKDIINHFEPSPQDLVIDLSDYGFLFDEEAALMAFYSGDKSSFKVLIERSLSDPDINKSENVRHLNRVKSHRKWFPKEPKPASITKAISQYGDKNKDIVRFRGRRPSKIKKSTNSEEKSPALSLEENKGEMLDVNGDPVKVIQLPPGISVDPQNISDVIEYLNRSQLT